MSMLMLLSFILASSAQSTIYFIQNTELIYDATDPKFVDCYQGCVALALNTDYKCTGFNYSSYFTAGYGNCTFCYGDETPEFELTLKEPAACCATQLATYQPLIATTCNDGWTSFNGSCYQEFSNPSGLTWEKAEAECEKLGGNLAAIHSLAENEFLTQMIYSNNCSKNPITTWKVGTAWLGGKGNLTSGMMTLTRWADNSRLDFQNFCNSNLSNDLRKSLVLRPYRCDEEEYGQWALAAVDIVMTEYICGIKAN